MVIIINKLYYHDFEVKDTDLLKQKDAINPLYSLMVVCSL